jgi:hypothetical protein
MGSGKDCPTTPIRYHEGCQEATLNELKREGRETEGELDPAGNLSRNRQGKQEARWVYVRAKPIICPNLDNIAPCRTILGEANST